LAAHQDADQTPLLYIHRPILDKSFHGKPKSGVFTPVRTLFCMGNAISHTKPSLFSHTKNLRERHQKFFGAKFQVQLSHQLSKTSHQPPPGLRLILVTRCLRAPTFAAASPVRIGHQLSIVRGVRCPATAPGGPYRILGATTYRGHPPARVGERHRPKKKCSESRGFRAWGRVGGRHSKKIIFGVT